MKYMTVLLLMSWLLTIAILALLLNHPERDDPERHEFLMYWFVMTYISSRWVYLHCNQEEEPDESE